MDNKNTIYPKKKKVSWHRLIWATFVVPKHTFISWLAVLNRLPTKERIKAWGLEVDDKCVMCRNAEETRDHVFFGCTFFKKIWNEVLALCGKAKEVTSWREKVEWAISRLKGKSLSSTILRIAWNAAIYFIWIERNKRIYQEKEGTMTQMEQ